MINKDMNTAHLKKQKGFTLIELLVVIGILAVLLAITLIAINPAHQFGLANDTKRRSDTLQILNAVGQYMAENGGILPPSVVALANDVVTPISEADMPGLCDDLVTTYMPALPTAPELNSPDIEEADCATYTAIGYSIARDANNRVTVSADAPDIAATITVTR